MIKIVSTSPYTDQKMGTAGLRKKTRIAMQENYIENFLQSIFNTIPNLSEKSFLVGGDGRYLNKVDSFEFPGLSGMDKMSALMQGLRDKPLTEIAGHTIVKVTDYQKPEETGLPAANVLIYKLDNGETVVVRPSGTEPKIKIYYTTLGKNLEEAEAEKEKLAEALKPIMA